MTTNREAFTIDNPYGHMTRNGDPARIVCTNRDSTDGRPIKEKS